MNQKRENDKKKSRRLSSSAVRENLWGYSFVALPIIGMIVFVVIPFAMSIYSSFTAWPLGQSVFDAKFIGFKNYSRLFQDARFWDSLKNTFYYMVGIPIGLILSLFFASLMNRKTKSNNFFRVIYYTPVICSVVAITFIFQHLFTSDGGGINGILQSLGVEDLPLWFHSPFYARMMIVAMCVWKGLGVSIILYIAGMQGISPTYYEAAKIDGAGWFQTFRKITLPLLTPVTFYLVVTGIIGGAQMYVEPRLLFNNYGPGESTFTTVMYLYDQTFWHSKAGYGAAIAIILGVIIFAVTAIQFSVNERVGRI